MLYVSYEKTNNNFGFLSLNCICQLFFCGIYINFSI